MRAVWTILPVLVSLGGALGTVCPQGYYDSAGTCKLCKMGSYGATSGLMAQTQCTDCPVGKYGASMIATSEAACKTCPFPTTALWEGAKSCDIPKGYDMVVSPSSLPISMTADGSVIGGKSYNASASTYSAGRNAFNAFSNVTSTATSSHSWKSKSYSYYNRTVAGVGAYVTNINIPGFRVYDSVNKSTSWSLTGVTVQYDYGEWLQIQLPFGATIGKIAIRSAFGTGAGAPANFLFAGSSDGVRWTMIDFPNGILWNANQIIEFDLLWIYMWQEYSYFRVAITLTGLSSDGEVEIDKLWLFPFNVSMCLPGTYNDQRSLLVTTHCPNCPSGYYSTAYGLATSDECIGCVSGQYSVAGASACSQCPVGKFMEAGAQALGGTGTSSFCLPCGAGTYSTALGANNAATCVPAPVGAYCTGIALGNSSACVLCGAGTYSNVAGGSSNASCKACAAGTYSTSLGLVSSGQCTSCGEGSYSGATGGTGGDVTCIKSPAGAYCTGAGLVSSLQCVLCKAGTYSNASGGSSNASCTACGAGRYSTTLGLNSSAGCAGCGAGTYSSMTGIDTAGACTKGAAGRYCTGVGLVSSLQCELCGAGRYSTALGATNASACKEQEAGTYCTGSGTASSRECVNCSGVAGTYSAISGNGTVRCENCTVKPPGPTWFLAAKCGATNDTAYQACTRCNLTLVACTNASDAVCGEACEDSPMEQPGYDEWMSEAYKCRQGQYLHALGAGGAKDCRQCPPALVGLNGVYCERCGELEEPYFLDQSLCVCAPPARMNRTGGCVCPDGFQKDGRGGCGPCGSNTYGVGGGCYGCGAGNYSLGGGATACQACPEGMYRRSEQAECVACMEGQGWYSTDAVTGACVACNLSCTGVKGMRELGKCPGDASGKYKVCVPCARELPSGASWTSGGGGGNCLYTCNAGFYMEQKDGNGSCVKCSTAACAAGFMWRGCASDADRTCDEACVNASKPSFNSKWAVASRRDCPWECNSGFSAVVSDYVIFQIHECSLTG